MRLLDRVHLVGGGWLGYGLSDRHDSHVYLVDGGSESVLIDAGCGLGTAAIVDRVAAARLEKSAGRVLVTHGHADHGGGAGALARALGAVVGASPEVATMLREADEDATGLAIARSVGTYPPHLRLEPSTVELELGAQALAVGDVSITVVPTPGHAAGHLCFLASDGDQQALFTGDLIFARGRVAILGTPDTDLTALRASIARLRELVGDAPTALLPGHGSIAVTGAQDHLDIALDCFARGALPPPLLP